jgi:hypothetical protein
VVKNKIPWKGVEEMKSKLLLLVMWITILLSSNSFPQFNVIQSIDFDSQQRIVYGLTGNYDYSSVVRYKDGNLETWNLTQMYNLPFYWLSTTIDKNNAIWAFQ